MPRYPNSTLVHITMHIPWVHYESEQNPTEIEYTFAHVHFLSNLSLLQEQRIE